MLPGMDCLRIVQRIDIAIGGTAHTASVTHSGSEAQTNGSAGEGEAHLNTGFNGWLCLRHGEPLFQRPALGVPPPAVLPRDAISLPIVHCFIALTRAEWPSAYSANATVSCVVQKYRY